ncbi:MAG: aldo/keto reductase [Planctomycetes bacterium]|nr:aldo/keto reductase [Planctomycetota bacterium]
MQTRQLGDTDLKLTTVGLGTWAMGGPWEFGWGPQDDDEAIAAILASQEAGINWIDTAPIYGLGHAEELVGKALKQTNHKPIVATKCSLLWNDKREKVSCMKAQSIRQECLDSLERLGIETIDLYQIHWPEPDEDLEQAWEEMAKLEQEGKIRYLGASNFKLEQIKRVHEIHPVASLQPPYSMLHREVEDELLTYCADNNIGVVAYSPMQRGLLTGKFSPERLASLPLDDHRRKNSDFHEPKFTATLELVEQLKPIAERNDKTLAQLSISWILRRPEVTAAIVGARKPEQILETAPASDWDLNDDDIEQIEQLLVEHKEKISI